MIEHLLIGWSAYFFGSANAFTDEAIEILFEALPASVENAGDCLSRVRWLPTASLSMSR
jgi:hypothetical protein